MLITAHGGALGTGRNTPAFFDTIKDYKVDAIEVDIYQRGGHLYISHFPKLRMKKVLSLEFVFAWLTSTNFKVNCDVKRKGLLAPVTALAKEYNLQDRLIFTGAVDKRDILLASAGEIYLNNGIFSPLKVTTASLGEIKQTIGDLNCPFIAGLNLNYKYIDNAFLDKAKELGIALSLYTVDNEQRLKELVEREELANITTNIVDKALKYRST